MMNCIQTLRAYTLTADYDCSSKMTQDFEDEAIDTKFRFNTAERIGNTLFQPMKWVFIEHDKSDNCLKKTALVIAGIFTATIALVGYIFKRIGEALNPHTQVRNQAVNELKSIIHVTVDSPDFQKILKNSYETPEELTDKFKQELNDTLLSQEVKNEIAHDWATIALRIENQVQNANPILQLDQDRLLFLAGHEIQTKLNSFFDDYQTTLNIKDRAMPYVDRFNHFLDQLKA